jgi:transcriptional regulator with XRE-family HTH domain
MNLGKRIKACRLEAGLSQRQLCGDYMTRNMLSQIESGAARPSMDTLTYLARQLGKTVSFFLEEQTVTSPNQPIMSRAREAYAQGKTEALEEALSQFRSPDDTFQEEYNLLLFHLHTQKACQALADGRNPYAVALLKKALACQGIYITGPMRDACLLLLAQAGEPEQLPSADAVLLARAQLADSPQRRLELLAAAEDHTTAQWNYLYAEAEFSLKRYREAASHYAQADQTPAVLARQEDCFRELGDYKQAYEFACRRRN